MIFLALGLLAVSVILYAMTGESDTIAGLPRDDFMRLVTPLSIFIFFMSALPRVSKGKVAEALAAFGSWAAIGLVLIALYSYRSEINEVGGRIAQELQPGAVQTVSPGAAGRGTVIAIRKGGDGHFIARTQVNGKVVRMIVDTGASTVVLRPEDAKRAGIRLQDLDYTIAVETANGRALAASVRLARLSVGELSLDRVEALVTKPGVLQQSLLGMSFLSRLKSYEFSGNQLTMKS